MVVQRRLAAILVADVAGFSRLMGEDEEGTLATLTAHRTKLIEPCIAEHRGRIVKTTGDGLLVEFASVVDAVKCAVAFQEGMVERNLEMSAAQRIEFRIGINLGDVIVQDDDVYGDGVNVAARLEGLANPGGVVVSGSVHEQVRGKVAFGFDDLGSQAVKNIVDPVRAFRVVAASTASTSNDDALPLPDKPSIAVLPFANMSGDPEQEYFADGIAEDIITALSRFRGFFVIARNSSFTYKGQNVDVRQVGHELGVRYVLEGSVRKGGNRLRITAQLVEASTGNHLWAERYDGAVEDVFDLQDNITEGVVGAIEPSVRQAEIERARQKKPDNLDAYDLHQRALPHFWANTAEEGVKAISLLDEALDLDPSYSAAHGLAALCHMLRFVQGGMDPDEKAAAIYHARTVLALGADDANALAFAGIVIANAEQDLGAALSAVKKAVALNPSSARSYANLGWVQMRIGDDDAALESAQRSIRLSPFDPFNFGPESTVSILLLRKGRFEEALEAARRTIQSNASFGLGYAMLAASCVRLGRLVEAKDAVRRLLQIHPQYRIQSLRIIGSGGSAQDSINAALREAGLPE
jgi:TolB-like protein